MSSTIATTKKYGVETAGATEAAPTHRIRVTLYSTDLKAVEKVCASFIKSAKQKNLVVKGPIRMPIKKLRITTRKTPCGEGSKTWDKFELRIYKRIVDIHAPAEMMRSISTFATIDANVDVEVTVSDEAH